MEDGQRSSRPRESEILALIERSGGEMSFAEIGRILGISRERVRMLARRAGCEARRQASPQLTCAQCGRAFRASPSQIKAGRRFCSWDCYAAFRALRRETASLKFTCEVCGKTYTRGYRAGFRARFCSGTCHDRWLSMVWRSRVTPQRKRLLALVAAGKSYNEMALELGIKKQTVKNEMALLVKAIGARSVAHAVAIAISQSWISPLKDKD